MPKLIVIAGCNGAGKSTFAPSFLPEGYVSFDYDRIYLEHYNSLADSELRSTFAANYTSQLFENKVKQAIETKNDFCYETNFDALPLEWPKIFKKQGYELVLIFFCIANQDIARHRIQVRTEFKGHFVNNATIDLKWKEGYKNANLNFDFFDHVLFVDNSKQNEVYSNLLQITDNQITLLTDELPTYFKHRLPRVFDVTKHTY